jgi:hypothetical protein
VAGGFVDRCEIFVDGNNPFPPHPQEGQRLKAAELQLDLPSGKHTLSPGGLEFTVGADGTVTATSPALAAQGGRVRVLMAPLVLETRDAETGARRVPAILQPILDSGGRVFDRPWHFSPRYPTCAMIYVPVGTKLALQPQGAELAVGATKVELKSDPTGTIQADGPTVVVTMMPLRFTFQRHGHQVGRGSSVTLAGPLLFMEHSSVYQWWAPSCDYKWLLPASAAPYELRVQHTVHELGRIAPGAWLSPSLSLSNRESPHASLLVSRLDERSDGTYTFLAGISKLKFRSGEAIEVRCTFHQDGISPAMKGAHLEAFVRPEQFVPARDVAPWQPHEGCGGRRARATAKLPDDLATNRYRLRLAMVEAGGGCDGDSGLPRLRRRRRQAAATGDRQSPAACSTVELLVRRRDRSAGNRATEGGVERKPCACTSAASALDRTLDGALREGAGRRGDIRKGGCSTPISPARSNRAITRSARRR